MQCYCSYCSFEKDKCSSRCTFLHLVYSPSQIKVINLSSCNETLINGKPVSEVEIEHLDVLTISDRSFRFEFPLSVQKEAKSPKVSEWCISGVFGFNYA